MIQQLSEWYTRDQNSVVACDEHQVYTIADLKLNVSRWIEFLAPQEQVMIGAHFHSLWQAWSFCLAMWSLNKTPCLLGDFAHYSNKDITALFDGVLYEDDIKTQKLNHQFDFSFSPLKSSCEIAFMTSGSSGHAKMVKKQFWQLEREIELLQTAWSPAGDVTFIGSASHQHLYGFTFRLCWPFLTAQPIFLPICRYGEDIARQAMSLGLRAFILISTPSHLTRLNQIENWCDIFRRCQFIVSSTGPLAAEHSQQIGRITGCSIREIYGSTETGIMAWKSEQLAGHHEWRFFKGIEVSQKDDGQYLHSPLLNNEHRLDDQLQIKGREFKLLGRIDRIVKLEGKRVNLVEIETCIKSHSGIQDAAAVVIQLRNRAEIAVVCELRRANEDYNLGEIKAQLEQVLVAQFAQVVCPRRWRFTLSLPRNQQGKLATSVMRSWFLEKRQDFPQLKKIQIQQESCQYQFLVQQKVHYFNGHFDGAPILPGVVQIHWAVHYGRNSFPVRGAFKKLEVIKFQKVIQPGALVTLEVNYKPSSNKLVFTYKQGEHTMSSGRICFE